jgi:hypothetical protein
MGCTDCGRKGGCDHRKQGMFAAIDEELARLYPTRRWGERDDESALAGDPGGAPAADDIEAVAADLARRLDTLALVRRGEPDEWCDYVYVLCLGRTPSIIEVREGIAEPAAVEDEDGGGDLVEERYLRLALSAVGRYAGVQEVAMTLGRAGGGGDGAGGAGGELTITERVRSGVFDPILLKRFQGLVAVLAEHDIRHLDFGELLEPPADFDPGEYPENYGTTPVIANYLFYPQPPASVNTVVLPHSDPLSPHQHSDPLSPRERGEG